MGFGRMCIEHEPKLPRVFVRGRPWPPQPVVEKTALRLPPVVRTAPRALG
jgi:hypothetical protein